MNKMKQKSRVKMRIKEEKLNTKKYGGNHKSQERQKRRRRRRGRNRKRRRDITSRMKSCNL